MSFFDAIVVGETAGLGTHLFEAAEIKRFAALYDPQAFHLDEEAAKVSLLGGLCASGWHTAAIYMRLNVDHRDRIAAAWIAGGNAAPNFGPSPGIRNIRWPKPVMADDSVTYHRTVTGKRLSASRPGWGIVETHVEAVNQRGEPVFSCDGAAFCSTD
ncbi:MaoC family dehydratase [Mangrovicella endophytica]|uniref:MaoC family dehydratase n=1 Tax=Mangrovicella endophytica TaxID=2066697 RepID=UPI000C9EA71F|nr:MaoC family dehydratase [Mangrovicella endophytica]